MPTYISLLRAINVGGNKKIRMTDLQQLYEQCGCTAVQTYIQSGNVVLQTTLVASELSANIEKAIHDQYGFEVAVCCLLPADIEQIIAQTPYPDDIANTYFTLLYHPPTSTNALLPDAYLPDRFHITDQVVYVNCPNGGYGTTKLSNSFLEKKLRTTATTRNYNTLRKLLDMAQ